MLIYFKGGNKKKWPFKIVAMIAKYGVNIKASNFPYLIYIFVSLFASSLL